MYKKQVCLHHCRKFIGWEFLFNPTNSTRIYYFGVGQLGAQSRSYSFKREGVILKSITDSFLINKYIFDLWIGIVHNATEFCVKEKKHSTAFVLLTREVKSTRPIHINFSLHTIMTKFSPLLKSLLFFFIR